MSRLRAASVVLVLGAARFAYASAPTAATSAASSIASTSAVLNGSGNPDGEATTGWFRYDTTSPGTCNDTFGTRVPATSGTGLGTGVATVTYAITASSLNPGTTYFFCAITSNGSGTAFGSVLSFVTLGAPTVTTTGASNITATTAQLNGSANPTGVTSTGWFRIATTDPGTCNDTFGTRIPTSTASNAALGSGTTPVTYAFNTNTVLSLSPGTTYYYCAIASNSFGTSFGASSSFTTAVVAPSVTTQAATGVTSSAATLNGSVNPGGGATTAWFRYSATNPGSCSDTFGTRVPSTGGVSLGSGNTAVPVSQALSGLTQGTTYYYCALASNSSGTSFGGLTTVVTATAPTVTTNAASLVTNTTATLNGAATPNGDNATGWFRYDTTSPGTCNDSFGTRVPTSGGTALGAGASSVAFAQAVSGLAPNTTYYVCAIASNSLGTSYGTVQSFQTFDAPAVTTSAATSITTTYALLNGSADPNGSSATGWFRLSTTSPGTCNDSFGTRLPASSGTGLGAGTAPVTFNYYTYNVLTLTPGTTYYYCAIASNTYGTSFGSVVSFSTPAALPSVATGAATGVGSSVATLNASANPGGGDTTAWFRYGTANPGTCNDTFGTRVPTTSGTDLGASNASVAFTQSLTGLAQGTTYYVCAIGSNSAGTAFGGVTSFTTFTAPTVTTSAVSGISNVQATFNGTANPNGGTTTAWFRFDTTNPGTCNDSFGVRVPTTGGVAMGAGTSAASYSQPASGLLPRTTYYVCAIASNSLGTSVGSVQTFTTLDQPTVTTSAATGITSTYALLNASANPNGSSATGWFRFSTTNPGTCNDTFGTRLPASSGAALGSGTTAVNYNYYTYTVLTGTPGTTYYFCAIASNAYGTSVGSVLTFTTPAVAPSISTGSATAITDTTATLNGSGIAGGADTTVWFRYSASNPGGCSDTFGTRVPATGGTDIGSGNTSVALTQALTGLSQGTTYYYCAIGTNSAGTTFGGLGSFTTNNVPTVTTGATSAISDSTAQLNGTANPNGNTATGWFRYDTTNPGTCNDSFGTRVPASGGTALGSGLSAVSYSQAVSSLTASTTYYVCAIASNGLGTAVGAVTTFTTLAKAAVTTLAATGITTTYALLNGSANPNGASTTGWFRLSTTSPGTCNDTFGTRMPTSSGTALGAGTTPVTFNYYTYNVLTLTPGTTYYYCAIAQNSFGTSFGAVLSFTTAVALPSVSTAAVTNLSASGATLNGSANPGGGDTTAWFRYSPTNPGSCSDTFGTRVATSGGTDLGAGNATATFSQDITGLSQGTIYYYCAIASNSAGTSFGTLASFTTPSPPTVTTNAPSVVSNNNATLSGTANPNGATATGWFRYSTTNPVTCDDSFGTRAPASGGTALGAGTSGTLYTAAVTGLAPNTTYYVCAIASNTLGTSFGTPVSFQTLDVPTVTTQAATSLTTTYALLNGSANPNGSSATGWFRVATTNPGSCNDTFGTRMPSSSGTALGAGRAAVAFNYYTYNVLTLSPGTTYYYCAIASNAYGTSFGSVVTFTTPAAVPSIATGAATGISATAATLNGSGNPGGGDTTVWFRYSATNPVTCNDTFGTRVPGTGGTDIGAGNATVNFTQALTGLAQGTIYYYCAIGSSSAGTSFGSVTSFTTFTSPTVTTGAASGVSNVQATLNGTANPNGVTATGWFRFSTTNPVTCDDSFGSRVPSVGGVALGAGTAATSYSQPVSGLLANTTYYVCALASNSLGTSVGTVMSFTTLDKPTVTTTPATSVTSSYALLNGAADPNGSSTTAWFRISTADPGGCNDTFGTRMPTSSGTALGAGTIAVSYNYYTYNVMTLSPGTTYYYCAIAQNAYGTSFGAEQSFTTPAVLPSISTGAASALTSTGATLNGTGNPGGADTTGWFRYSTTNPGGCSDTFGTRVPATGGTDIGSGNANVTFTQVLSNLAPNTTYYYCAIGSSSVGINYGSLVSFITPATPTVATLAATPVTSTTATLNASGTPNTLATTGWFRYSTASATTCNDTFGTRVPATGGTSLGSGTTAVPYSNQITSLLPGTTYYFCAIANNAQGTSVGSVLSFTTPVNDQAPGVTTLAATALSGTAATLNASANPNGQVASGWFRYATTNPGSCNDTFGTRVPATGGTALGSGTSPVSYLQALTGLAPTTTYYFCALASNAAGTSVGSVLNFTTPAASTVTTLAASGIGSTTATLNGSATPNGDTTTGWFRYATTNPGTCNDTFGTRVPSPTGGSNLGSGTTAVSFSQALTGLSTNTTYYFCAIAQNSSGTSFGAVLSFVTPLAPTVTTADATSVASTSATVNGSANPNGGATTGWFRYSTTNPGSCDDVFGTRAPATGGFDLGSVTTAVSYAQALTGLASNTTYYFCAIAQNGVGTSFGTVLSFTTPAPPTVTTSAATAVAGTSATLNGSANPHLADATAYFRYATTNPGTCNDTFGTRTPTSGGTDVGAGTADVPFTQALTTLTKGTTYYFCAIATNSEGTAFGSVASFTTLAAPTVTTLAATSVTSTGVTFNGSANPGGDDTTGYFRYGSTNPGTCSDTFGTRAPASGGTDLGTGTTATGFSNAATGLLPGTTYYFCAVAQNSTGSAFGAVLSFITPAPPSVTTLAASGVTSSGATLNGSASPNGLMTAGWFRYDTTSPGTCNDTFGTRAPATGGVDLGSGSAAAAFTQALTGLLPGTTYYVCAIAQNAAGTAAGAPLMFTTTALPPTVTTSSVSSVTLNGATLNGSANPNGGDSTGWFRYGTTMPTSCNDTFGTRVPASSGSPLGAGSTAVPFTQAITGLVGGTTYYVCAIASNAAGTAFGAVVSFRIDTPSPTVATVAASDLTATTVTLNGTANPNGSDATGWFRFDTTMPTSCNDSFGTRTPATGGTDVGAGSTAAPYTAALTGLEPNQTYYYCAIGSNIGGAAFGTVMMFTTQTAAPTVQTLAAGTDPASGHKTLVGAANPHGLAGSGWFQYDTTDPGTCTSTFGTRVPSTDITLGAGHADVSLTTTLGDLPAGTYYYCAAASNSVGTSYGTVMSFVILSTGSDGGTADGGGTDGGAGGAGGAGGGNADGGRNDASGTGGAAGNTDGGRGGAGGGNGGSGGAAGHGGAGGGTGGSSAGNGGGNDAGTTTGGGKSGCSCGVAASSPGFGALGGLLVALCLALRRRRR
jgi:hypothetical protein